MEREIIFRGRGKSGIWHYGCLLKRQVRGKDKYIYTIVESAPVKDLGDERYRDAGVLTAAVVQEDTIGQYTGMRDINGERIFEGDSIKRTDTAVLGGYGELYGTVVFLEGQWWIKPAGKWNIPLFDESAELEIVEE